MRVRPALPADYATFARLFPELRVPDPVPEESKFLEEMMATTLVAQRDEGPVGLAWFQGGGGVGFLRIIVTDPAARRTGAGRALMDAVRARLREGGCTAWCLNVFPHNTAAVALYESYGLRRAYASKVVSFPWALLDGTSASGPDARVIEPADDARVERDTKIIPGLFADARTKKTPRVLRMIEDDGRAVAAAIFDPSFPGAYPFYARDVGLAVSLLHALRPHKRATDDALRVVLADQPDVADALVARGGTLVLETMHMRGPV